MQLGMSALCQKRTLCPRTESLGRRGYVEDSDGNLATSTVVAHILEGQFALGGELHESLELTHFPTAVIVDQFIEDDDRAGREHVRDIRKNRLRCAVEITIYVHQRDLGAAMFADEARQGILEEALDKPDVAADRGEPAADAERAFLCPERPSLGQALE